MSMLQLKTLWLSREKLRFNHDTAEIMRSTDAGIADFFLDDAKTFILYETQWRTYGTRVLVGQRLQGRKGP